MDYLPFLVFLGIMVVLETKQAEDTLAEFRLLALKFEGQNFDKKAWKLIHSPWVFGKRIFVIMICLSASVTSTSGTAETLIATAMFIMFYWAFWDTMYGAGVLKKKAWTLGTATIFDRIVPPKLQLPVYIVKVLLMLFLMIYVGKYY